MSINRHNLRRNYGFLEMQILWLLNKKKSYGYELMKILSDMKGKRITQGTVYPTLAKLKSEGLIKSEKVGNKNMYEITKRGKKISFELCEDFSKMFIGIFKDFVCSKCKARK